MRTPGILSLFLVLATLSPALGQNEDDAALEEKIRAMAIGIGNAYACSEPDQRPTFKEEAHHLFDLIVQDVGSNFAFVYATSLGYGSSVSIEELDCPALLAQWEEIRVDYDLKGKE